MLLIFFRKLLRTTFRSLASWTDLRGLTLGTPSPLLFTFNAQLLGFLMMSDFEVSAVLLWPFIVLEFPYGQLLPMNILSDLSKVPSPTYSQRLCILTVSLHSFIVGFVLASVTPYVTCASTLAL